MSNGLKKNRDHKRADSSVDYLHNEEAGGIGRLNPHVPKSGVDSDGSEQKSKEYRPPYPLNPTNGRNQTKAIVRI
jgi:hypothetical protein